MEVSWTPEAIKVYKDWIEYLSNEVSDDLSSWELQFISSIEDRLNSGTNLTQKQAEKLEQIYSEKIERVR